MTRILPPTGLRPLIACIALVFALGGAATAPAHAESTETTSSSAAIETAVATSTGLRLLSTPSNYGDVAVLVATVTLDGPINLSGMQVEFAVDGTTASSGFLVYSGSGSFFAFGVLGTQIPAGTHSLTAHFPGVQASDDSPASATASTSEPVSVTLSRIPSTIAITSSPATVSVFEPFDVAVEVQGGANPGPFGTVDLYAEGIRIGTTTANDTGAALFTGVVAPFGTTELVAEYRFQETGNFEGSRSAPIPLTVEAVETRTTASLESSSIPVGGSATLTGAVTTAGTSVADPRGTLDILVDGALTNSVALVSDREEDGTAEFSSQLEGLEVGEHRVSVRFHSEEGFLESFGKELTLSVLPLASTISVGDSTVTGSPGAPAKVDVEVSSTGPGSARAADTATSAADSLQGTVTATIADVPVGAPLTLVDGRGTLELTGLGVGTHDVEVTFTPSDSAVRGSAATVTAVISADPAPSPTPDNSPAAEPTVPLSTASAAVIAETGAEDIGPLALWAGSLVILGALAVAAARTLRRRS